MFKRSSAWSDEARFAHTQHMVEVCPSGLLPTVSQNMASGGVSLNWPDVCHCPVNGGASFEVHLWDEATCTSGCTSSEGDAINVFCNCDGDHVATCPFDVCPIGTCHPMCSQASHDGDTIYCHCACHG